MEWDTIKQYGIYAVLALLAVSVVLNLAGKRMDNRQMIEKFQDMTDNLSKVTDKLNKTVERMEGLFAKKTAIPIKEEDSDSEEEDKVERFRDMRRYKRGDDYKLL